MATILHAKVITLFTAFILFPLATAGVKGFAFTLGIATLVSLFTAVLFTQAVLSTVGRSKILHSPRAWGGERSFPPRARSARVGSAYGGISTSAAPAAGSSRCQGASSPSARS